MPERDQLKLMFLRKPASWLPSLRVNTYRDFYPPLPHHRSNPCRQENEGPLVWKPLEGSFQDLKPLPKRYKVCALSGKSLGAVCHNRGSPALIESH